MPPVETDYKAGDIILRFFPVEREWRAYWHAGAVVHKGTSRGKTNPGGALDALFANIVTAGAN